MGWGGVGVVVMSLCENNEKRHLKGKPKKRKRRKDEKESLLRTQRQRHKTTKAPRKRDYESVNTISTHYVTKKV